MQSTANASDLLRPWVALSSSGEAQWVWRLSGHDEVTTCLPEFWSTDWFFQTIWKIKCLRCIWTWILIFVHIINIINIIQYHQYHQYHQYIYIYISSISSWFPAQSMLFDWKIWKNPAANIVANHPASPWGPCALWGGRCKRLHWWPGAGHRHGGNDGFVKVV